MTKTLQTTLSLLGVGALAFTLSACGGSAAPAASSAASNAPATAQNVTSSEPASASASSAPASSASAAGGDDSTAAGLRAIATAEAADGGKAHSIDDVDDDGTWEVEVLVGEQSIEYDISADGATVVSRADTEDDDLDDAERAALQGASVTLEQAITTAVAEGGAALDDAELDDESGSWAWEVSLQGRTDDIVVDPATGQVRGS